MNLAGIAARLRKRDTWIVIGGLGAAATAVLAFSNRGGSAAAPDYAPGYYGGDVPAGAGGGDSADSRSDLNALTTPAATQDTITYAAAPAPTISSPAPAPAPAPVTGYVNGQPVSPDTIIWRHPPSYFSAPAPAPAPAPSAATGYVNGQPVSPSTIVWKTAVPDTSPVIDYSSTSPTGTPTATTSVLDPGYTYTSTGGGGGSTLNAEAVSGPVLAP